MKPAPYTRDEIVLAARDCSARVAAALGGGGLAARFVRNYAESSGRRALLAHPAHFRNLIQTIGREALLAMAARIEAGLPRRFSAEGGRRGFPKTGATNEAAALANLFRVEFYGKLAETLDWEHEQLEDFWRDMDLYARAGKVRRRRGERTRLGVRHRRDSQKVRSGPAGPFADRCAFLLDSSLLEKARRAAAKFHAELERAAQRALAAAFRRARTAGGETERKKTRDKRARKKSEGKRRTSRRTG